METYATQKSENLLRRLEALEAVINLMKVPTEEAESEKFYEALEQYNAIR